MKDLKFLAYLHSIWFSHKNLKKLFEIDENYKEVYDNLTFEFLISLWIRSDRAQKIIDLKINFDESKVDEALNERNVKIVTIHSNEYPEGLFDLEDYPYFFYLRGSLPEGNYFSVVWSRAMTSYSLKTMKEVIPDLSNNFTIVSGGAIWCDSVSHRWALELWNKTIVCIGTWIDVDYPANNKKMYQEIAEWNGWIISVFPVWTNPNQFNFPVRNPLIAALWIWTLLVEAKLKSWSLITIRHAKKINRPIFTFPWEAFKANFEWNLSLIKSWEWKMVLESKDILEEYSLWASKKWKVKTPEFEDFLQKEIFEYLLLEPLKVDEIAEKSGKNISDISLSLSFMEIQWHVNKISWWFYEVL